jgi:hypothetical protein
MESISSCSALSSKGSCSLSEVAHLRLIARMLDETGIANASVRSDLFEKLRLTITHETLLEIDGQLQYFEGVVSVLTRDVRPLRTEMTVSG